MAEAQVDIEALTERAYGALNDQDLDAFLTVIHPEVEFTSIVAEAEGTTFRGHDGVREWWVTVPGAFEEVHWDLQRVRSAGDRAIAEVVMSGRLGGVPVELRIWQALRLRDGLPCWWCFFRTEDEATAAVDLPKA
jgi:ketosteroid isomerase-like protein